MLEYYISQHLEKTRINKIETFFILIIEVSTIVSGLIPADVNLIGHSILVWIGMLTVFPGLFIFAKNLKKARKWTYFCLLSLIVITTLILLVFLFPLPSGLLQRLFTWFFSFWELYQPTN